MKRNEINEKILHVSKRSSDFNSQYSWGEVKKIIAEKGIELMDSDTLRIFSKDGFNHGDSACDPSYDITVHRTREENDAEFEKRKLFIEALAAQNKKARREKYEELKKEFEQ